MNEEAIRAILMELNTDFYEAALRKDDHKELRLRAVALLNAIEKILEALLEDQNDQRG